MEINKNWKLHLLEDYYEEMEDAHKYINLAEEAEKDDCYITANALEMLAHDEFTHAKWLRNKLEEWGIPHGNKEADWQSLERHFGYR